MQLENLIRDADTFAQTLPPGRGADGFVTDTDPLNAVRTTLSLMIAGYTPVLGAKAHHLDDCDAQTFCWSNAPTDAAHQTDLRTLPVLSWQQGSASIKLEDLGRAPAFCTSGSTGAGAIIRKSWAPLLAEAHYLRTLSGLTGGGLVVSLVPPVHIFGFLYSVLLPYVAHADVVYATYDAAVLSDADLVITVPALWPALTSILETHPIPLVISSGAPWDAAREAAFLEQRVRTRAATRLLDVLGSTESGGLGWRELGVPPGNVFKLFDGVELGLSPAGGFRLRSPYTEPPLQWLALADEFVIDSDDKRFFVYKGRGDRVFKLGGQRFALAEIERHLSDVLDGAAVRCRFRDDASLPKGGELIAYAAVSELDFALVRRTYLTRYETPFPARIFLVDEFRPNAAGKVALFELEAQARRCLP